MAWASGFEDQHLTFYFCLLTNMKPLVVTKAKWSTPIGFIHGQNKNTITKVTAVWKQTWLQPIKSYLGRGRGWNQSSSEWWKVVSRPLKKTKKFNKMIQTLLEIVTSYGMNSIPFSPSKPTFTSSRHSWDLLKTGNKPLKKKKFWQNESSNK